MAWVGIGCGGIVILGVIGVGLAIGWGVKKAKEFAKNPSKSTAELIVMGNKDLEKVSEDDATGEMTIRVKSTGETTTIKYDDLAKGKITVKDKDGNVTQIGGGDVSKIPSWVPRYPGAAAESAMFQTEDPKAISGIMNYQTSDTVDQVKDFYDKETGKLSMTSSSNASGTINGVSTLSMTFSGGKKDLTISASAKAGEPLAVTAIYSEKK